MTLALYSQSCCKVALCYICTYWYVALPILYSEHWIPFTGVIILLYNSDFDMLLINLTAYKALSAQRVRACFAQKQIGKIKMEGGSGKEGDGREQGRREGGNREREEGGISEGGREGMMQFVVTVILQLNAKKLF